MAGLIRLGKLETATDDTTAAWLNKDASRSQKAVDARIEDVAAGIIAADPTVKEAAADAVTEDLAGRDLVEGSDHRLVQPVLTETVKYAVVDKDGRRSWLEVDQDGKPTQHAVQLMLAAGVGTGGLPDGSITLAKLADDVIDRIPEPVTAADAMIPAARQLWGRGPDGAARPIASDAATVAFYGDSLFDGWPRPPFLADRSNSLPGVFATLYPGGTVYNGGRTGQTADEIALRQGGLVLRGTVAGGSIPASGPVTVTPVGVYGWQLDRTWDSLGTLNGVPGTMARTGSTVTFTRTTPGVAAATPGVVEFEAAPAASYRNNVQVILAGRNDIAYASPAGDIVDRVVTATVAMMESHPALLRRVLLLGTITSTAETNGTTGHADVVAINTTLQQLYPGNFWDYRSWLTHECIYELGITPTSGDLANIGNDTLPPSIMTDAIHYSPATAAKAAQKIKSVLDVKGWLN